MAKPVTTFRVRVFRRFWLRVWVWASGDGPGAKILDPAKDRASTHWEDGISRWKLCDLHLVAREATNADTIHHELSHLMPYMRRRFQREGYRLDQEAAICASEKAFSDIVAGLKLAGLWSH